MSLIAELKRRNVFRVGVAYAIVGWLLLEVASVVLPALHLPDWALTLLVVFVVAGFPLALIVAWAFELTPEGLKREAEVDRTESTTHITGRKLDFAIIGLLVIAEVELPARRMPDRLSQIYVCFALDSLRRQLECPSNDQCQWETSNNENYQ